MASFAHRGIYQPPNINPKQHMSNINLKNDKNIAKKQGITSAEDLEIKVAQSSGFGEIDPFTAILLAGTFIAAGISSGCIGQENSTNDTNEDTYDYNFDGIIVNNRTTLLNTLIRSARYMQTVNNGTHNVTAANNFFKYGRNVPILIDGVDSRVDELIKDDIKVTVLDVRLETPGWERKKWTSFLTYFKGWGLGLKNNTRIIQVYEKGYHEVINEHEGNPYNATIDVSRNSGWKIRDILKNK
jgi:hypothetical protein